MHVSLQTYHGIQIAVTSSVKAASFFASKWIHIHCNSFVEEYYCNQQQLMRKNDNPDMAKFGYNGSKIRIQKDVSFTSRNIQGKHIKRNSCSYFKYLRNCSKTINQKMNLNDFQSILIVLSYSLFLNYKGDKIPKKWVRGQLIKKTSGKQKGEGGENTKMLRSEGEDHFLILSYHCN